MSTCNMFAFITCKHTAKTAALQRAVMFAASPAASPITGTGILVDGSFTAK